MRRMQEALRPLGLATAALLLMPVVVSPSPASATPVAGGATFEGTALLPTFPCSTSPSPCGGGSFSGTWGGHLAGIDGTGGTSAVFDATWALGSVGASFSYSELACLAGVETLVGTASGSGSAHAGPGQVVGEWKDTTLGLPRAVTDVRLTFVFDWVRIGNSATIVIRPGSSLDIHVAGLGWRVVSTSEQEGTAAFVPITVGSPSVPMCSTPLNNVSGQIAGSLTFR